MKLTTGKALILLLFVAFALRMAAGVWWQSRSGDRFAFGDSESYWGLGQAIAAGEPYQFGNADSRIFRTPGYPVLLAPIFIIFGSDASILWGRALSAVCGTLSVVGVWWLAGRLFNRRAGWIAAIVATVYPGAIAMSVFVLSEGPFCPLMLLNLALWIVAWQAKSRGRALGFAMAAGAVAGLATLVRPSWLLFVPFALMIALLVKLLAGCFSGRGVRACRGHVSANSDVAVPTGSYFLRALALIVGLILVMIPWWIRNARVVGRFVPTTLEVGASLYDGLNPAATGASEMSFIDPFIDRQRSNPSSAEPLEVRLDRQMREEAFGWAKTHPAQAARLAWTKFLKMWGIWASEPRLSSWPFTLVMILIYVPILLLGILCGARTIRFGIPYWLCWLPAVYFTLLHVVFVSSIRYREPAMLGLIVLAAGLVASWPRGESTKEG